MYDQLTNLPQEKFLKDRYNMYVEGQCSYMVAIDFAKLKYINDNFGHQEGDNSLKLFGTLTKKYFKDSIVSRLHGDEFCILTSVDSEEIKRRLEMIRNDIKVHHETSNIKFPFSFNCGIKRCEADYNLTKEQADYAMYCAKRANELYLDFSAEDFCTKIEEETFIDKTDKMIKDPNSKFKFDYQIVKDYQTDKEKLMAIYARDENGTSLFDYDKYRLLRKNHRMKQVDLRILNEFFSKYDKDDFKDLDIMVNVSYQTVSALEFDFTDLIKNIIKDRKIQPENIILVINVLEFDNNILILCEEIKKLKDAGFKIGLDDFNINTLQTIIQIMSEVDIDYIKIRNITLFRGMNNNKSSILIKTFINLLVDFGAVPIFAKIEVPELFDYIKNICPESLVKGNYISKEVSFEDKC